MLSCTLPTGTTDSLRLILTFFGVRNGSGTAAHFGRDESFRSATRLACAGWPETDVLRSFDHAILERQETAVADIQAWQLTDCTQPQAGAYRAVIGRSAVGEVIGRPAALGEPGRPTTAGAALWPGLLAALRR